MGLLNYSEFLFETYGKVRVESAEKKLFMTLIKNDSSIELHERIYFEVCLESGLLNEFVNALETGDFTNLNEAIAINEESLKDKFKRKYAETKEKIAKGGKEALNKLSDSGKKILQVGADILNPFKLILKKIAGAVKSAWEKGKAAIMGLASQVKEKITPMMKNIIKDGDKQKSVVSELDTMKQIAGFGATWITGGFVEGMEKSAEKAAKEDEGMFFGNYLEAAGITVITEMLENGDSPESIVESLSKDFATMEGLETRLDEGGHGESGGLDIPFVSALMKKIGHTPPFSYFHDIGAKAAESANNALEKFSNMIKALGGPGPFKYAVLGGIFGAVIGYLTESGAKTAVFGALEVISKVLGVAIPGVGILYSIIKYTGLSLLVYGIASELAGQGEKEDKGEKHSEEDKDKDKEKKE